MLTRLPVVLRRTLRISLLMLHLAWGVTVAGLVFPWFKPVHRDRFITAWSRRLLRVLGVRAQLAPAHVAAVRHDDPLRAVRAAFNIAYAAFARELGLGSSNEQSNHSDWTRLKDDVGQMAAAFLLARKPYAD